MSEQNISLGQFAEIAKIEMDRINREIKDGIPDAFQLGWLKAIGYLTLAVRDEADLDGSWDTSQIVPFAHVPRERSWASADKWWQHLESSGKLPTDT